MAAGASTEWASCVLQALVLGDVDLQNEVASQVRRGNQLQPILLSGHCAHEVSCPYAVLHMAWLRRHARHVCTGWMPAHGLQTREQPQCTSAILPILPFNTLPRAVACIPPTSSFAITMHLRNPASSLGLQHAPKGGGLHTAYEVNWHHIAPPPHLDCNMPLRAVACTRPTSLFATTKHLGNPALSLTLLCTPGRWPAHRLRADLPFNP